MIQLRGPPFKGVSLLGFRVIDWRLSSRIEVGTDRALDTLTESSLTVFTAIINDLQMKFIPLIFWKKLLTVLFGFNHILAISKTPKLGQTMNMGINGKGRNTKGLGDHNGSGFMSNSW